MFVLLGGINMKNKNMIRTIHPVKRTVSFDKSYDARTFITLYQDLFYHSKDEAAWNHNGYMVRNYPDKMVVHFTMVKKDFDSIVKNIGLKKKTDNEWIYC